MRLYTIKLVATCYIFFDTLIYFLKTNYSLSNKVLMFGTYIKLFMLFVISPIYSQNTTSIHNFKIWYSDIYSLVNLYCEIFLRGDYYFYSNKNRPFIIDCGANIGVSILYFKYLYPDCKIISFEPNNGSLDLLKRTIRINKLKNIKVINKAISSKKGQLKLYFSMNGGDVKATAKANTQVDPNYSPNNMAIVQTIILSKYITKTIDMLKVDIEGSEYDAFRDLNKHKSLRFVKNIAMEIHHNFDNSSSLASLLSVLEKSTMVYQIDSRCIPIAPAGKPQTMILYATKRL